MVSMKVLRRKVRKFQQIAREFTENSSLHGVKYIGNRETSLVEKIAWLILFIAGASFAIYMCYNYWAKWDASPMITVFDSTTLSLKEVPFPAFTICNNNKISRKKLESLMRNPRYATVSYEDIRLALRIMNKVDLALPEKFGDDIPRISAALEGAQISMDELMFLMKETLTPCEEIIVDCTWQDKPISCSELFVGRATNDGFCCSFNAFNVQGFLNYVKLDEWKNYLYKYEEAVAQNNVLPDPPEPTNFQNLSIRYTNATMENTNSAGIFAGLSVMLDARIDDYNGTTSNANGFRFLLHDAEDFPDVGDRGFLLGADSEIHVGFEGIIISADPAVRNVDLQKRECYMDEEFKLDHFGRYTASNCLMECLTERMIDRYGCRPYFYPVPFTLPICTLANLTSVAQLLAEARADQDVHCPFCLPTCNSVRFRTYFSYAPFPGQSFSSSLLRKRLVHNNTEYKEMDKDGTFTNYVRENMIPINLFYQEKTGMRYKMQLRYGWEDFVSALGGLFGLGIGLSIISCLEVLYFLCFRWCFNRSRRVGPGSVDTEPSFEPISSSVLMPTRKRHPLLLSVKQQLEQHYRQNHQNLCTPPSNFAFRGDPFHYVAPEPVPGLVVQPISYPVAVQHQRQETTVYHALLGALPPIPKTLSQYNGWDTDTATFY